MGKRILVTEKIADEGIDALRNRGYEVDVKLNLTPEQLKAEIGPYEALIVRSATKVTEDLLEAADNLKIIGRAGVTIDNIDLEAATRRNVVVCNAPVSNIVSAAEHTMALLLACARRIPQAYDSMHRGEWERVAFTGTELYGKTLAIFGLGRIGGLVAERARAFGMTLIGFDPYCSRERAEQLGVTLCDSMDEAIAQADFITVHLPRTEETVGMFGRDQFAAMKDGVILVNAARGGIFDVEAAADFLAAGKIFAMGLDVYDEEPCTESPLHELEGAVLTPHIAAVTREAQVRAGSQIAEYVWEGLEGSIVPTAINLTALPPEVMDEVSPFIPACRMLGRLLAQLGDGTPDHLSVTLAGTLADVQADALLAGTLDGLMAYRREGSVTGGNAAAVAARHGIAVETAHVRDAGEYAAAVKVRTDAGEGAVTVYGESGAFRIISLLDYKIDIAPAHHALIFEYIDGPGRIGVIGTVLGEAGVNITTMQIGTNPAQDTALVFVNVDGDVPAGVLDTLRERIELKNLWRVSL